MKTVDWHALIHPSADRIDIETTKGRERPPALPQRPYLMRPLEAGTEQHAHARESGGPWTLDEVPHEEIEKPDEGQCHPQCIHQEQRLETLTPPCGAMLGRREEMRQPVVPQVVVEVIGVARRHVAFADLRHDGHLPDEIGREVGAVGTPGRGRDRRARREGRQRPARRAQRGSRARGRRA